MNKYFEFLKNLSIEDRRHTLSDGNAINDRDAFIFNDDIE